MNPSSSLIVYKGLTPLRSLPPCFRLGPAIESCFQKRTVNTLKYVMQVNLGPVVWQYVTVGSALIRVQQEVAPWKVNYLFISSCGPFGSERNALWQGS